MNELYLPHSWLDEAWWSHYRRLAALLEASGEESGVAPEALVGAYASLARELVRGAHADLATALATALVTGEPPVRSTAVRGGARQLAAGQRALLEADLQVLSHAARRELAAEVKAVGGTTVPRLTELAADAPNESVGRLRSALLSATIPDLLATYCHELAAGGGGPAALHGALRYRGAKLVGVRSPAAARWSELVGLDEQLQRLAANSEALLARRGAHNALLYGPRGSGKSTAVRGLLDRYQADGLRLVELPLEELVELPEILERLGGRPQSFVLFVDDLSFEEGDRGYRPLRTILEGGLAGRPANVALYATSNRRHLLKERFGERPDPLDDDVHRWDTQHERLALADRFGLVITFPDAGQRRYLELVRELARRTQLGHEALDEAAIRFAEWGNGYSGRTAAQFIDSLRQRS